MKRTLTLRVDGDEFTVTAYRQGDAIVVERDGKQHQVRIVSEVMQYEPSEVASAPKSSAASQSAASGGPSAATGNAAAPGRGGKGAAEQSAAGTNIAAPMSGVVKEVLVAQGATVKAGQRLVVMEAMKMDIFVDAPVAGTVASVAVQPSSTVAGGDVLLTISGGEA